MNTKAPNILLIVTDQHRLSAVGAYGDTPCQTPNLDRLAREGVRFENAYTTSPLCSPARGSVITGQYPHTHGITNNIYALGCMLNEVVDGPNLLPRQLERCGYQLGYSGKWHLGTERFPEHIATAEVRRPCTMPRDLGFQGQNFEGHGGGGHGYQAYRDYLSERRLVHEVTPTVTPSGQSFPWNGVLRGGVESTVAYFLAEHSNEMLSHFTNSAEPFVIWHNFWGPHTPYWVPQSYLDRYRDVDIPEWPNYTWPSRDMSGPHRVSVFPEADCMVWDDWAELIRHYYAFTTMIDEQIGRMLDHLESTGVLDDTVVIFTADHGESLGDHGGLFNKGWTHFEETLRIPLIVRFPDGRGAGTVREELVSLADIYPTVVELAGGCCKDAKIHGESLLPLVDSTSSGWREGVVTEFHGLESHPFLQRTVRHGHMKYGFNGVMDDELYDLAKDPHEMTNVIHHPDYKDIAAELRQYLADWMADTGDQALASFKRLGNAA